MRHIQKSAWLLVLLSVVLQVLIFPLPNFYFFTWIAVTPLLVALLRARQPETLQLTEGSRLLPASPWQGFLLGYFCGILWFAGTCYWVFNTMKQFGGISAAAALGILLLFCLYLGLYFGVFGAIISFAAKSSMQRALVIAPFAWTAVELARTRVSGFPWDLLGVTQINNVPFSHIATVTGVYGISFEIMVVNTAFAAAFLVRREKRNALRIVAIAAAVVLQSGSLLQPANLPTTHTAVLVQQNLPVVQEAAWTGKNFQAALNEFSELSENPPGHPSGKPDLIVWPESPAPFYTNDPIFRQSLSTLAQKTDTWVVAGSMGVPPNQFQPEKEIYNSAVLVSPSGDWVDRYDKVHLVPFGEYLPFPSLFSFASGLTQEVGEFTHGSSRKPLRAGGTKLGVFICYESIFPDEIRQFAKQGAQVFVNLSNDGWYGDSGAYAQHFEQSRMRAVENDRWLLLDTNTGVTASVDPYGRVVTRVSRKIRTAIPAPYSLSNSVTFYTQHGDWFAYLCAIICIVALVARIPFRKGTTTHHGRGTRAGILNS